MISLSKYLKINAWVGAFLLSFGLMWLMMIAPGMFVLYGMLLFATGIMQLLAALKITTSYKEYPQWLEAGMGKYWLMTLAYFIGLYAVCQMFATYDLIFMLWLFAAPLPIAIYQVLLFNKYNNQLLVETGLQMDDQVSTALKA